MAAPRLYVLPARAAPVALVLRRGPTEWFHLLRWDLETLTVDVGAWFHGTIYPRRSDVSADGRRFSYFAMGRGPRRGIPITPSRRSPGSPRSPCGWVVTWAHDLNGLEPDPAEAPSWAHTW